VGFSVKVKKDDLLKIRTKIEKGLRQATSPTEMLSLGKVAADQIKKRTRLGKGVDDSKRLSPLAPLSTKPKSTVDQRKRKKEKGNLSPLTTPKKSNLTETGQLLDSITTKNAAQGKIDVGFTDKRNDLETNSAIAKYAEDGSSNRPKRPFMNLAEFEIEKLRKIIRANIKKLLGD
jgi:phage gpG-like protein